MFSYNYREFYDKKYNYTVYCDYNYYFVYMQYKNAYFFSIFLQSAEKNKVNCLAKKKCNQKEQAYCLAVIY